MNRADLVKDVLSKSKVEVSESQVEEVLKAFTESVTSNLLKGEKITINGFGTFDVAERAESIRRNPRTGEKFTAPACKVPKFKFSNSFKNLF